MSTSQKAYDTTFHWETPDLKCCLSAHVVLLWCNTQHFKRLQIIVQGGSVLMNIFPSQDQETLNSANVVNAADVNWFYPALYCNMLRILWAAYPQKMHLQKMIKHMSYTVPFKLRMTKSVTNLFSIISFDIICSGLLTQGKKARCDIVLKNTPWPVMRPGVMRYNLLSELWIKTGQLRKWMGSRNWFWRLTMSGPVY